MWDEGYPRRLRVTSNETGYQALIPYRFPFILAGILAMTPWIPWRFSLRTMVIATALVAVGLGIIAM
jgi:hypothetical protein